MISLKDYLASGQTVLSNQLIDHYHDLGMSNHEFLLWMQLYRYHEAGEGFPDLAAVAEVMSISQEEIYRLLNQLVQNNLISIESKLVAGKRSDYYDFSPTYEKLGALQQQRNKKDEQQNFEFKVQSLYQMFETEFGRALSPIEYQRIGQWLEEDQYKPELIQLALKEAVLNQAYSLNYIDRILLSWERKNITTQQQVEEESKRRKRQMLQKETSSTEKKLPKISMHNWLEEE